MDKLVKWLENLLRAQKKSRAWRTFVSCLAAIVVFTTTYSLILPAITVEQSATEDVGGLVLDEADPGSTGAEAEAPGEVVTVDADNETTGETSDENPDEVAQEEAPAAEEEAAQTAPTEETASENKTTQSAASQTETAQTSESKAAVAEEVREPVNGEVQTIGDKRVMTLKGDDFDVVVSGDLSVGVSDRTVLSVRGIPDAEVVKSFSDRISDELLKIFVDKKTTEILYQLVFTDENLVEYTPAGYFDVQFIFHNNTTSHTGEKIYAAIYDYLTDEMVLAEKNGDEYETPVISLDEYGIIKGITLKGMHFDEYSDIITLVAGPVNEELKLAAEKVTTDSTSTESKAESGTEKAKSKPSQKSTEKRTDSSEVKTISAQGNDYTVELSYGTDAKIPDDAKLEVKEIENSTWLYKLYLKNARAAMGLDNNEVLGSEQARFFDITITSGGNEIQPAANVNVSIQYDKPVVGTQKSNSADVSASVIHFAEDATNFVETSTENTQSVEFTAESFSVYGIIYTVDFEYEGKEFSMPGDRYMTLVDLLAELDIKVTNEQIKYAVFDEPSLVKTYVADSDISYKSLIAYEEDKNEPLIAVADLKGEYIEAENKYENVVIRKGTWVLESIAPFDSQHVLTVKTGNETYAINVSDAQNADGTWHLDDDGVTTSFTVSTQSQTDNISHSASLDLDFAYVISQSTLAEMKAAVNAGQSIVITYDASTALAGKASALDVSDGSLMVGRRRVGSYSIHDGKMTMTITATDWLLGRTTLSGTFGFSIKMDEEGTKNDDNETFEFPGAGDIEVTFKKKTEEGSKNYNAVQNTDGSWTLNYTASIQVNQELDDLAFSDVLGGLQRLDSSSVKIDGNSVNVTPTSSGFTISSADFKSAINNTKVPAKTYQVTYSTTVSANDLMHDEAGSTNETNDASWTVNGNADNTVPGGHTEKEIPYITPPTPDISKSADPASGTTLSTDGQTINYTIVVGDADHTLNQLNVVDNMTDLQTLEGAITITYADGTTETMPSSAVRWINDSSFSANTAQVFDYTFTTSKNGPATITYTTKAITQAQAKEAGIYGTQTIANNAGLTNYNKWSSTQNPIPFKEQEKVPVGKTAAVSDVDEEGKWQPGATVTYTLTIGTNEGDEPTNLSNMHIWDNMTDLQKLDPSSIQMAITRPNGSTESVTNVVKNGQTVPVSQTIDSQATDDSYSKNDVTAFDFYMPSDAGSGQLVITYTTTIASAEAANAAGVYGEVTIRNVGNGGNGSNGTSGPGKFPEEPHVDVEKTVNSKKEETLTSIETEEDRTVHYDVIFDGTKEGKSLDNVLILDEMTDIQKLVLDESGNAAITITVENEPVDDIKDSSGNILLSKADWQNETKSFVMPKATGNYNEDGYNWTFLDDDSYSASNMVRVFTYKLPTGLGVNKITVSFDAEMISQEEANEAGIAGTQDAYNKVSADNRSDQVVTHVPYEEEVTHKPKIEKEFDHWDETNNRLYWKLVVGKQNDSAFPLEGVTVSESKGSANLLIDGYKEGEGNYEEIHTYYQPTQIDWKEGYGNPSVSGDNLSFSLFDVAHAIVTTASGTVLQPGVDYTVDKTNASFHFNQLDEEIEIVFAVDSPINPATGQKVNLATGYHMYNVATVTTKEGRGDSDDGDARYEREDVYVNKTSAYDKSTKVITYTVLLNPDAAKVDPDKTEIWFADKLEEGVTLLNWADETSTNPTIYMGIYGKQSGSINMNYNLLAEQYRTVPVEQEGSSIKAINLAGKSINGGVEDHPVAGSAGLNKLCYMIQYKVSVEDDWPNITSSESGYKDYMNTATFTAGDDIYSGSTVTRVTTDEYIKKYDTTQTDDDGFVINDTGDRSWTLTYSVDINPNREQLNTSENPYLQVTDIIDTQVELDTDSVKLIKIAANGTETEITDDLDISYNDNSRILSISNIPDKEYVKLTFAVDSRTQGTNVFNNTATVIGGGSHSSSVHKEHSIATSYATLGGDEVSIHLKKIDENNITKKLPGAEFKLYEAVWECGTPSPALMDRLMADWIDDNYFSNPNKDYSYIYENFKITGYQEVTSAEKQKDSQHGQGKVYVTGADDGMISWDEGLLYDMKVYAWEEVAAPEGYTGVLNDKHWFIVYPEKSESDTVYNTQNYPWGTGDNSYIAQCIAWALDNATSMANKRDDGSNITIASMGDGVVWTATNVASDKTSISATKEWEGDMDNLFDTRPKNGIKLQLYRKHQDGTNVETVGSPVPINADKTTGEWPTYDWYNLDKYYAAGTDSDGTTLEEEWLYYVIEQQVPEYTTTYENNDGISSGEIIIKNKLIPTNTSITVKKEFNPDGNDKPEQIIVELWKINTPIGEEPEEPQFTGQTAALSELNLWTWTFDGLETRSNNGYLTYTIVERQTTDVVSRGYTITYSDNGEGVAEGEITVTNNLPGNLEVKKTIAGIERELTETEKQKITFTVSGPNDFSETFTYADMENGVKSFEKITPGDYTVTETNDLTPVGYQQVSTVYKVGEDGEETTGKEGIVAVNGGETASISFTNNYEKRTTEFEFKKLWKNADGTSYDTWKKDIVVVLYRKQKNADVSNNDPIISTITARMVEGVVTATGEPTISITVEEPAAGSERTGYSFKITGLDAVDADDNEYEYYVKEQEVEEYNTSYADSHGNIIVDGTFASAGGQIINTPVIAVSLPSTGGPGTKLFYGIGIAFITMAGILFFIKKKRIRSIADLSERRW